MNRLPAIVNGEDVRFESLSVASLAGGIDIFEEIHLKLLDAAPFASVAPASHGIEREMARCQSTSERLTLRRKDGANFIKRFQVGDRIRSWRSADRFLIDQLDAGQMFDSLNRSKFSHRQRLDTKGTGDGSVKCIFDQCALAGP